MVILLICLSSPDGVMTGTWMDCFYHIPVQVYMGIS